MFCIFIHVDLGGRLEARTLWKGRDEAIIWEMERAYFRHSIFVATCVYMHIVKNIYMFMCFVCFEYMLTRFAGKGSMELNEASVDGTDRVGRGIFF